MVASANLIDSGTVLARRSVESRNRCTPWCAAVPPRSCRVDHDDRGDMVIGWLVRLAVGLVVGGILLFDAVSVGMAHVSVADASQAGAQAGADSWHARPDVQLAYDAAVAAAASHPADQISRDAFAIDADGTVHVRMDRTATTLVLFRVHPLARWATAGSSASVRAVG